MTDDQSKTGARSVTAPDATSAPPREPTEEMIHAVSAIHHPGLSIRWSTVWTTMHDAWTRSQGGQSRQDEAAGTGQTRTSRTSPGPRVEFRRESLAHLHPEQVTEVLGRRASEWLAEGWDVVSITDSGVVYLRRTVQAAPAEPVVTLPVSAVRAARQALDDWTATYASELCSEDMVSGAYRRIGEGGGTLAHICAVRAPLDVALEGVGDAA